MWNKRHLNTCHLRRGVGVGFGGGVGSRKIFFVWTPQVDIKGHFPPFYALDPERFSSRDDLTDGFYENNCSLKKIKKQIDVIPTNTSCLFCSLSSSQHYCHQMSIHLPWMSNGLNLSDGIMCFIIHPLHRSRIWVVTRCSGNDMKNTQLHWNASIQNVQPSLSPLRP